VGEVGVESPKSKEESQEPKIEDIESGDDEMDAQSDGASEPE